MRYVKGQTFIYLSIYKLRQEAWITHRASSTTSSRKKKGKRKEKKISNTTHQNENTLETTRKETEMQKQCHGNYENVTFSLSVKSFISTFTCQVSACELQPFSCHDLANVIYSQTAKTVFSHLKVCY